MGQYGGKDVVGIRRKRDVQFSVQQVHRCTVRPIWKRLKLFRIIVSVNQLSLHGAVAEMCKEYETLHDRSGRQPVVGGQSSSSLLLSVIKIEITLDCDDLANKDFPSKQDGERIEKLSQQDR